MNSRTRFNRALSTLGVAGLLLPVGAGAQELASSSFAGAGMSQSVDFTMIGGFNPTAGRPSTSGQLDGYSVNHYPGQFAGVVTPVVVQEPEVHLVPTGPGLLTLVAVPDLPGWLWTRSEDLFRWSFLPDPTANPVLIEISRQREFFRLELP